VAPDHAPAEPPSGAVQPGPDEPSSVSPVHPAPERAAPPRPSTGSAGPSPATAAGPSAPPAPPAPRPASEHHANASKRHRPVAQRPHAPVPDTGDPAMSAGAAHTGPPGAGSAAPPPRPQTDVEWKPTLLLPTDGSNGNPRR
jgi:hypothetical protein